MNRIAEKNKLLKLSRKKAFIAYITAGFPNISTTLKLAKTLESNGVDFIELGLPFSDPVADGPTIQRASAAALKNGMNLKKFFLLVSTLRETSEIPLIMMSYYNPVFKYGVGRFARDAAKCGLDGVIIPDLPPEEATELNRSLLSQGIYQIFLISPITEPSRVKMIAEASTGFIYYISLRGVTGARRKLPVDLARHVRLIKKTTKTPVFVGFGISQPQHVKQITKVADGVIVGSALVEIIEKNKSKRDLYKKIGAYIRSMRKVA